MHGKITDVCVVQLNKTIPPPGKSTDYVKTGCFTCAIGPQKAYNFPAVYAQVNMIDNSRTAKIFYQSVSLQCGQRISPD
jgi:hypothetical protein